MFLFPQIISWNSTLVECADQAHIRETFYSANDMKELFQKIEINNVILLLIYTEDSKGIFNKIKFLQQTVPLQ